MSNEIVAAGSYYSDKFEFVNDKLRQHVKLANKEIENIKDKVNELVAIVHNDNKDWHLKKICDYIAGRNDDLEEYGLSSRTIYNYLNEENRQLLDNTGRPKKMLQNNDVEQRFESVQTNVLEDSSRTQQMIKRLEARLNEIETKYERLIAPYKIEDTILVKGQDIPIIIHVDPYKRTAIPELDEKKARQLKGF